MLFDRYDVIILVDPARKERPQLALGLFCLAERELASSNRQSAISMKISIAYCHLKQE